MPNAIITMKNNKDTIIHHSMLKVLDILSHSNIIRKRTEDNYA